MSACIINQCANQPLIGLIGVIGTNNRDLGRNYLFCHGSILVFNFLCSTRNHPLGHHHAALQSQLFAVISGICIIVVEPCIGRTRVRIVGQMGYA